MKNIKNNFFTVGALTILCTSNLLAQSAQGKEKNVTVNKENKADANTRDLIMHHLGSFQKNDLEAVISDYTAESILITQDAIYKGPTEIKGFFTSLLVHFPKQKSDFHLDKLIVNNGLAYIVWYAKTPSLDVPFGTDTFVLKNGKIYQQTFAGQMNFKK